MIHASYQLARDSSTFSKVAAITGGGTGIGYQVARAYAEAGANIALFYNTSAEAIDKAAGLEKEFGIKSKAYKVPGKCSVNCLLTYFGND